MKSKEHVVNFLLQGKIRVSPYDHKFLSNLQVIIHRDQRITTNQASLAEAIILKNSRQILNAGHDVKDLLELPWTSQVIQTSSDFKAAKVSLENDKIIIKVPFDKRFISHFKDQIDDNPFHWDKIDRQYSAKFSTTALKQAAKSLTRFFLEVKYCDVLFPIMREIQSYETDLIWNPTLVKRAGALYIAGATNALMNALEGVVLKEDVSTYHCLSQFGVRVHDSLLTSAGERFAAEYFTSLDLDVAVLNLPAFMRAVGCEDVVFNGGTSGTIRNALTPVLADANINTHFINRLNLLPSTKTAILIQPDSLPKGRANKFGKCLIIKNSRPVDLK